MPDAVIEEIKSREVDGLVDVPKSLPTVGLRPGAQVKILARPVPRFRGHPCRAAAAPAGRSAARAARQSDAGDIAEGRC